MKIDTSKITGYADMSAEEKLAALEAFEYEDHSAEAARYKQAADKASSDAAEWKKKHHALMDDDSRSQQEAQEKLEALEAELESLKKEKLVSDYTARFASLGYSAELAAETAAAMADGDTAKVFANQQKFLAGMTKKIKADLLAQTPPPAGDNGGGDSGGVDKKKFAAMSIVEKQKFATEHPDEYKALIGG